MAEAAAQHLMGAQTRDPFGLAVEGANTAAVVDCDHSGPRIV
jgi:hypothetical protein